MRTPEPERSPEGEEPVAALWRRRLRRMAAVWVVAAAALVIIHWVQEQDVFFRALLAPVRVIVLGLAAAASWHAVRGRTRRDRRRGERRTNARRAREQGPPPAP